jgi:hypothetical protein
VNDGKRAKRGKKYKRAFALLFFCGHVETKREMEIENKGSEGKGGKKGKR